MPLQKKKDKYENPSLVTRKEEKQSNTIQATAEQALRFRNAQRDTKKELVDSYQDYKRVQDLQKQKAREEKSSVMTGIRNSYEKYMREQGKMPYEDPGIDRMTQDRFKTLDALDVNGYNAPDVQRDYSLEAPAESEKLDRSDPSILDKAIYTLTNILGFRGGDIVNKAFDGKMHINEGLGVGREIRGLNWIEIANMANELNGDKESDSFGQQFLANLNAGYNAQRENEAWSDYMNFPTDTARDAAEAWSRRSQKYAENNAELLDDENVKAGLISKDLASYLPQLADQIKYQAAPSIIGATFAGAKGFKYGRLLGSAGYSYQSMRGAAFKELISNGVDEKTALNAASNEALLSTVVEIGDEIIDQAVGAIPGVSGVLDGVKDKITAQLWSRFGKFVAKAGVEGLGYILNIGSEGLEEYMQESVSIANERQRGNGNVLELLGDAMGIAFDGIADLGNMAHGKEVSEDSQRLYDAFGGGARLALMLHPAGRATNIATEVIRNNATGARIKSSGKAYDIFQVAKEAVQNADVMEEAAKTSIEKLNAADQKKQAEEFMSKAVTAAEDGKQLSAYEIGKQANQNEANARSTVIPHIMEKEAEEQKHVQLIDDAIQESAENGGYVKDETILKILDDDKAVEIMAQETGKNFDKLSLQESVEAIKDYMHTATKDYRDERYVNMKADTMGELGSRVLRNNYQNSGIEDVQTYADTVDALYSYGAQLDRNVNVMTNEVVDAAIQSTGATINREVAHRAIIAGFNDIGNGNIELKGGSNGETNGDSGSGRIYRLAERKGSESTSGKRRKTAAGTSSRQERLRHVKDVVNAQIRTRNGQRVSSSELGFTDGTDEKRNVVLDDQAIEELGYTERVNGLESRTGAKVMLVSGTMEQAVQYKDGKTEIINVRGSFDSATNTLIVQVDNRNLDFEQIGLHEEFHAKFKNASAAEHDRMINEIRDKIAGHDDAEFMALIDMYADKYGWKNMGYSEEYIVEEILADAYAGIDVWDYLTPMLGATRYTDAVRKYAEAIVPSEMYGDDGFAKYSTADEFEMAAPLEETDRLIAIHNMHESALQSMIDLGGLAMPSFAVKPAHIGHTTYGIISVVAGKNSIDPMTDRDAVIYGGDAWTPTFPEVHIKPSNKALKSISKRMDKVFADEKLYKYGGLGTNTYHIALDEDNARDAFERWGSFEDAYGRNNMMKLMFLKETGRGVPITQMEKAYKNGYDRSVFDKVNALIDVEKRYDYSVNELKDEYGKEINNILREFYLEKYGDKKFGLRLADQMAPEGGEAGFNDIMDLLDITARYNYDRSVGNNTQLDTSTVDESIRKAFEVDGVQEEYDSWLKELGKGTIEKKGIRNDKDMFTPSGNRRTFEQLHYDFTLDNIVKAMRSEAKQGRVQFMSGPGSVKDAALKSYKTIEEVRAERDRILDTLGEEGNSAYDEFHDATLEIAKKINSNDWLSGADDLADILGHAKTASRILNYMRKEFSYLHPTMDLAEDIENLGKMANSLPMEYFEAKLYRAFPVSEALAYVVPDNLDENLKKNLKAAGGNVIEYKAEDMDDRLKKINGIEGARFSTEDSLQDSEGEYNDNTLIGGDEYAERLRDGRVLWFEESNTKRSSTAAYRAAAQVIRRNLESRRFSEVSGKGANSTDSEGGLISKEDAQKLIGSVLVNRDGKPVPLYHVSTTRFDHHKYGDVGFHYGYDYQARRLAELNEYSSPVYRRAYVNVKNPAVIMTDPDIWTVSETLRLLRDYNYITQDEYETIVMISSAEEENISSKGDEKQIYNTDAAKELRALLKDNGIDGIIYANGNEGKGFSVIVFDDNQIVTTDKEYKSVQTQRNSTEDSDGNALTNQKQEDDYIRYSREMDEQAKVNFGSMFSGTGTVDFALRNMVNHRFAVEYDRQIAGVFKSNNGEEIFIGDVRDAVKQGYLDDKDVEYFHASPVCKNFSSQKHDSGEQPLDISTAQSVADAIDSLGPKIFTLENVKGYRNSRAVNLVKDALTRNGYVFDEHVYRASDYGGSTIRERYFIRAVKDVAEMPPMPEKVQGMSWYDTVSDLIPELPEWPMKVGGYMETRWNAIKDQVDTSRPVLILRGTKGGSLVYAEADEFSPTIIASDSEARIFMPDGRVLRATPRVLARIQGLPDSFKLPTQTSLANKVIGNGIPVQLTQAVAGSLLGQVDGVNDIRFSTEDAGYHAGDLGKAESYAQQGYYRGTGHFGTGTYFVGDESLIEKYNMRNGVKAPHEKVDFSKYNLYRPGERLGLKLHEALKVLDGGIDSKYLDAAIRGEYQYREPAYKAFYDRLDKYRAEGLEWDDAKIAAYQDELNGIDHEEIEYEFKTYDEFFKNYSKGWEDIDEDDYEFYKGEYVDYLKAISEEYNEEDSAMYDRLRDAVFNLQMMFGFNKETEKALRSTLSYQEEMQNASYEKQKVSDSLATVFMKSLGYDGIDVRGTNLDNVAYGSVIYDLKGKDLERKKAIGTARYSTESMSDAEQSIREENEYLKGAYASLLTEVRTDKRSASRMRTNANKTADRIREEYESRIDKTDLRDRMNHMVQDYIIGGEQNEGLAYQNAKNVAVDIARDIVNNAGRMKNADEYDRYLDLKKRVKNNDGIYLDPSLRGDPEKYQEIRKRLFGKVNLKNSGTPLDSFYQGLVNDFGELFDPDVAPGIDQLQTIEEVLNTLAPIYENPYNGRIAEAIELCANDILMSLTDGTIVPDASSQNARQQAKVEAARQSGIDYARKAIAAERVYEKKRIDNALAYYKNRDKKRLDSAERERLRRIANRLNNRKLPAATRALVEQYIGELDLISVKLTNKRLENLKDLRLWYDDQQVNNPDFVKDPEIEKLLQRLSTRQISELNIEEVRWLTTCLQNIENELAIAKKTIDTEDQRDIHIQAEESMADIDHSKGNGNNSFTQGIDSFFVQGTLSPIRAMKRIVGYNTESPIYLRTLELEQGQIKSFDWQRKAEANFLKWTNDSKFMESIVGKKAKMIDIGNGIQITPAMRMSLYLHSKNEQNMRHIIYGGVTVPNIKEYKSGNMSKAYGKGSQTIKLNAKQVNDIIAGMTDEEKAFANAAAKYFNGTSQESINEVSEKLKGYSLALVQNYFPINTNTNFTLADYETVKMDGTIEGMGFLKERQNASNPIYLRDMTDVLEKSITSTAKYVGLAIPVRNFNKLYNVSSSEFGDEAKAALEEMKNAKSLKDRYAARERMRNARELFTGSMRESVMQKWDIEGINYIEKMMADIQNPRGSRSAWAKMFGNIRSNYAGSVLSLSASVAMKQAASYPTAAAVLGWKPLSHAFTDVFKLGKRFDMDLVNKYTPLLWHRASNFNVQYLGNVGTSVNQNRLQKLLSSKPLNWITDMDIATTRLLWYASEHYVQDNNKALVKGSDSYYKAVAEIYNRVITETQPNYTTMERPELLRTDDTLLSSMMMFKTQSFQNFNVLYDAIGNYNAKKDAVKVLNSDENKAALADAKKGLLMASTSQVVQTFVFAAMNAVCAALMGRKDKYKDDEGEVTLESLSKQVGKDMISSAMSMVPFGGEIYNVLARVILGEKYYGFDNITASSLDDLFNAFIKASDSIKDGVDAITNKDGAEWDWNDQRINMDGILNAFTKAFGIPYDNASKIFEAIVQHVSSGVQGKYEGTYTYLRLTKKMSDTGAYYDNLFKAYENDKESYERLKKKMIEDGFDEEKIRNAMNSRLKKKAGVANVSDLDHKLVDPKYQDEYDEAINMLLKSPEYKKLSDEDQKSRRSAVESTLKDPDKMDEIEKAGLDIVTYSLYLTARKLADVQGDNNGSYTKEEKEAAVKMLLNSGEITSSDAAAIRKYGK